MNSDVQGDLAIKEETNYTDDDNDLFMENESQDIENDIVQEKIDLGYKNEVDDTTDEQNDYRDDDTDQNNSDESIFKKRRVWIDTNSLDRDEGDFGRAFEQLTDNDEEKHGESHSKLKSLLENLSHGIQTSDTLMRLAVAPEERIALALGYSKNTDKQRRKRKTSDEQYDIYLKAMESDYDLRTGIVNATLGENYLEEKWQKLAIKLNIVDGGPKLTVEEWKKRFRDWKNQTRLKSRKVGFHKNKDGSAVVKLSSLEERGLAIWGKPKISSYNTASKVQEPKTNHIAESIPTLSANLNNSQESDKCKEQQKPTDSLFIPSVNPITRDIIQSHSTATQTTLMSQTYLTSHTNVTSPSNFTSQINLTSRTNSCLSDEPTKPIQLDKVSESYVKLKEKKLKLEAIKLKFEIEKYKFENPNFRFNYNFPDL